MPKYHEKERKINILEHGGNVRAPKLWFERMRRIVNVQYPLYTLQEKDKIIGGIWNNYKTSTKEEIVLEYQTNGRKQEHKEELGKLY